MEEYDKAHLNDLEVRLRVHAFVPGRPMATQRFDIEESERARQKLIKAQGDLYSFWKAN
jgi:hypothetical protein